MAQTNQQRPPSRAQLIKKQSDAFKALVINRKPEIQAALPSQWQSGEGLNRFVRVCLTAMGTQPKLFECTQASVLAAMMKSAQLGLEPDGTLGQAHMVPFKDQCQLIVGYRGYIELGRRTGLVSMVRAVVVHEGDEFYYTEGLEPTLHHVPAEVLALKAGKSPEKPGKPIAAYAVVKFKDGETQFKVLFEWQIEKIRKMSRGSDHEDSPWRNWTEEMWQKTAIRQVYKLVPLNANDEAQRALAQAQGVDGGMFGPHALREGEVIAEGMGVSEQAPAEPEPEPEPQSKADKFVTERQAQQHGGMPHEPVGIYQPQHPPLQGVAQAQPPAEEKPKPKRQRRSRKPKAEPKPEAKTGAAAESEDDETPILEPPPGTPLTAADADECSNCNEKAVCWDPALGQVICHSCGRTATTDYVKRAAEQAKAQVDAPPEPEDEKPLPRARRRPRTQQNLPGVK